MDVIKIPNQEKDLSMDLKDLYFSFDNKQTR